MCVGGSCFRILLGGYERNAIHIRVGHIQGSPEKKKPSEREGGKGKGEGGRVFFFWATLYSPQAFYDFYA